MSMFSLGGSDWLGLGTMFGQMFQGTQMCGAKPVCSGPGCMEKLAKYNQCVSRSLSLAEDKLKAEQEQLKRDNRRKVIIVTSIVAAIVILGVTFILVKRKED